MNEFDKEYNYLNVESIDTTQQMVGVFGWMFIGLLISAVCAIYVASTPNFVYNIFATNLYWVLFIAEFGLVIALSAMINKLSNITMSIMFILFSIINGLTLSVIFYVFESQSIFLCFIVAAGMFNGFIWTCYKKGFNYIWSFLYHGVNWSNNCFTYKSVS